MRSKHVRGWIPAAVSISVGSAESYAYAVLCIAAATFIHCCLALAAGPITPFATYFPAVLIATLVGGPAPGTLAAALGGMIGYFGYGIPSDTMLELSQPAAGTLTYALSAACIIWGADHYRTLVQRLAAEEQLRKLTVQELAHRLKNKVATIQAIVSLKLRDHPDVRSELDAALTALAVADDLILSSENRGADLKSLLYAELKPYELSRVSLAGPAVMLPSKLASTLALVFHELTTNAAKYGALSFPEGSIGIRWDTNSGGLDLEWCEPDVQVRTADRQGFGSRLLAVALIPFGGQIERQVDGCGLRYRISLPKLQEQPR